MFEFAIKEELAKIGDGGKALNIVAWGEREAKLDLRKWVQGKDGLKAGKGLTLTREEAQDLAEALQAYLAR